LFRFRPWDSRKASIGQQPALGLAEVNRCHPGVFVRQIGHDFGFAGAVLGQPGYARLSDAMGARGGHACRLAPFLHQVAQALGGVSPLPLPWVRNSICPFGT